MTDISVGTNILIKRHIFFYHHHHHHHVVPLARLSLTLSRHFSLSFIASGRSSGLHSVSSHSSWMYVRAGRPAFARPYVGVYKSTSLISSPLLLQQCPACLARLTWIVFVIGGRYPYSWCPVGCCRQDLFKIARSILVWLPSSFFSSRFVSVHVVHPYSSIDTTATWKKLTQFLPGCCRIDTAVWMHFFFFYSPFYLVCFSLFSISLDTRVPRIVVPFVSVIGSGYTIFSIFHTFLWIYSVSQKWLHSSHFCRYLSISLHGTTLTKWHFDTMKSSLCAAYIT